MKAGFTVSIAAHLLFLAIILVSFSAMPLPENQQTEEVPITLVPLGESLALQKGEAEAAKKDKAAQKKTAPKPEVKPDAENAGNANIDTPQPEKKNIKEREVKSPPPPKGEENTKAETEAEKPAEPAPPQQPKPEEPKPEPAPQPEPAPAKAAEQKPAAPPKSEAAPSDDIADLLKADAAEPKPAPAPKAEEKPAPAAEEKPKLPPLPDKAPVPAPRPPEAQKPAPKQGEKDGAGAAKSRDALIDRTRTSGGGAKRSQEEAAFGADKTVGDNAALQQTLNNVIGGCVARNWDIGIIQGGSAYDLRVQVHFKLKRDGALDGEPELTPAGGDAKDRDVIVTQARTALKKCAPFKLPAEKYNQWHDVTVNMRAFPD